MFMNKGFGITIIGMACVAFLLGGLPVRSAVAENVYDIAITPLTVADCGSCHSSHFNRIKNNGAKHSGVVCTECHEIFHAYNPLRNNYAQIMPKCSSCHDAPHGQAEAVLKCLDCHQDPHQPLVSIPVPANLEGQCRICHSRVAASLQEKPSMHTEQECSSCHSEKHGRIPQCSECHESHSPAVQLATADCLACHPVHTPLQITYPIDQNKEVCGGCHADPYQQLAVKQTKHSALTCAKCHPRHGLIPACQECHGLPHGKNIHEKYKVCGTCHNIAHDLEK
jgi:predicted CXXCH cytochrome family protein